MRNQASSPLETVVTAQSSVKRTNTRLSATACAIVAIFAPRIAAATELLRPRATRKAISKLTLAAVLSFCFVASANSSILFERDLPSAGLNLAGSARSNIAAVQGSANVLGDDFTLAGGGMYLVDSITVWIVGNCAIGSTTCSAPNNFTPSTEFSSIQLFGGLDNGTNGPVNLLSASYSSTFVHYSGGQDYLSPNNGLFYPIFQITFGSLGLSVPGSQLYDFAVKGTPIGGNSFALHASTAGISGGTQQGADNCVLVYQGSPLFATGQACAGNFANFTNGADVNILVTGSAIAAVPEPSTIALSSMGLGLLVLAGFRRRARSPSRSAKDVSSVREI